MKRKRIILDLDDTSCRLVPRWLARFNADHHTHFTMNDIKSWMIADHLGVPWDELKQYLFEPGFFASLEPMKGVHKVVHSWHEMGHEILIVTMPVDFHPNIIQGKLQWVEYNFPWMKKENIVFAQRKDILDGDICIDDNADCVKNSQCPAKVLFMQPWNRELDLSFLHYRCDRWDQIETTLGLTPVDKKWGLV